MPSQTRCMHMTIAPHVHVITCAISYVIPCLIPYVIPCLIPCVIPCVISCIVFVCRFSIYRCSTSSGRREPLFSQWKICNADQMQSRVPLPALPPLLPPHFPLFRPPLLHLPLSLQRVAGDVEDAELNWKYSEYHGATPTKTSRTYN